MQRGLVKSMMCFGELAGGKDTCQKPSAVDLVDCRLHSKALVDGPVNATVKKPRGPDRIIIFYDEKRRPVVSMPLTCGYKKSSDGGRPPFAMSLRWVLLAAAAALVRSQDVVGGRCSQASGQQGTCTAIARCRSAMQDVRLGRFPVVCFYDGFVPFVCCGDQAPQQPPVAATTTPRAPTPSRQSQLRVSERKCREYSQFVSDSTCGIPQVRQLIFGGVPADPMELPHQAAVGYGPQSRIVFACGGSLISPRFVLTAAHCLEINNPINRLGVARWVRMGDLNIETDVDDQNAQQYSVSQVIANPDYRLPNKEHDIGLLRLDRDVQFNSWVRPACLGNSLSIPQGTTLLASGWGRTENAFNSPILLKVNLGPVEQRRCFDIFTEIGKRITNYDKALPGGIVERTMLCAGDLAGGRDACSGDSGGPLSMVRQDLQCMYDVVGVTAFGDGCGKVNTPGIYTRVAAYTSWIESVVWPGQ